MTNYKNTHSKNARRGIVLTLDIAIAMMLLLVSIAAAYASYGTPSRAGFDIQLMRNYLQDSATLMSDLGYLSDAANAENGSDTSGIRTVLRATPSTVCMQVSGYGTVLGDGLAGYWKFDEDSGSVAADSSGNGNVGTVYGGASFSSIGKNGHALTTDGASGYIDAGNASGLNPTTALTVSAWVKFDDANRKSTIVSKWGRSTNSHFSWLLFANWWENGRIDFLVSGDGGSYVGVNSGAGTIVQDKWHHVVGVYDGSSIKLYVDGVLRNNVTSGVPSSLMSVSTPLAIGIDYDTGAGDNPYRYFKGSLDEIRLYNRALTGDEVKLLYSDPSNILFVVDKPECAFSGGEVQTLTVPFVLNADQDANEYYFATLRAWVAGSGK